MPRADDPPPPAARASFSSIVGGTNVGDEMDADSSACCSKEGYSYHSTAVQLTLGVEGADKDGA